MQTNLVVSTQLEFYVRRKAGCIFAAIAAKFPKRYGWHHVVLERFDADSIDEAVQRGIDDPDTTTLSVLFPSVSDMTSFKELLRELALCKSLFAETTAQTSDCVCIGYRARVGSSLSWVSGFGPFSFLPETRRAPCTEIVMRVKPRPDYEWHLKDPIEGVIHLADLDMKEVPKRVLRKWWNATIGNTQKVLGHKPDIQSAAKTTFVVPRGEAE